MSIAILSDAWQRAAFGSTLLAVAALWGPVLLGIVLLGIVSLRAQAIDALPTLQEPANRPDKLPLSPEERRRLDQALRSKQFNEAEKLLAEAHERNPDSAELLKTLARISFQNQNHWNAAIAYKKAARIEPLDEASRFSLAMAYVVLDRREWARPELQTLAKASPDQPLYLYWLGRLDYDDQRFADAIEKFERVIAVDPSFIRAYDNLGLALDGVGRQREALEAFKKAIERNRKQTFPSPWPSLNLGTMLYRHGRVEEAEPYLREAVNNGRDLAQAQYQLAVLLENRGEAERAIEHLTRAAELDPADPKPHYALGRIYRRQGDEQKARAALARFRELDKNRSEKKKKSPL
jgi:tetratricopeptide (TPR) repeat protein